VGDALIAYVLEFEPILSALGRRPPARWIVAAVLAFHDESARIPRPPTWELAATDGSFRSEPRVGACPSTAGAPDDADLVITTEDEHLHPLLTRQLISATAVGTGAVTLDGDASALPRPVELFAFPHLAPTATP
jgi:hypothetical protein